MFEKKLGKDFFYDDKKYCWTMKCMPVDFIKAVTLDFYPKANKVLIRQENEWIKPALRWMIANVLNDDKMVREYIAAND